MRILKIRGADGTWLEVPAVKGTDGATFTPHMSVSGDLSWTNDKGLTNPQTINLMGKNGIWVGTDTPPSGYDVWVDTDAPLNSGDVEEYIREMVDARTGYDGTVYNSVGTAVREQVGSLKDQIVKVAGHVLDMPCSIMSAADKLDVNCEGYEGKKIFITNKNLLPQFPAITDHGITLVKNADGSVSLSGTADGAAVFQLSSNVMPNLGPGTYTVNAGNSVAVGDNNTYINVAIDGTYQTIYARLNSENGKVTFTVPEGSRVTAMRIRISSGVTLPEGFTMYPQCEEGAESTEFVKHEGYVLEPTSGEINGTDCFVGYNYICAQAGVTGSVKYVRMQSEKLDELEERLERIEGINFPTKRFAGKKIVCFGDSITGNFPAPTDYPSMIAEITRATVYNAGFGGCCMCDNGQTRKDFTMCRLVDAIVAGDFSAQRNSGVSITYGGTSTDYVPERLTMLEGIDWSEVDYITIAYGTNDWNSNYALDNAENPLDTTSYIGAFRYSVEKLLAAYPHIKILTITPLWRWWDTNTGMPSEIAADYIDSNDYAKGTGYKLWQYGDALVQAAKMYHVPVFDLYWNCMMTKNNRLLYFPANDGTHPNESGRRLMASMISARLESAY